MDEAGEAVPALEHVVDRFDDAGRARELGALCAKPRLQFGQQRRASLLSDPQALVGAHAIDVALNLEVLIDAPDRSSAIGEIAAVDRPRCAFLAISANSKKALRL